MATLIVETGAGLANANSYISSAEASTYHMDRGSSAAWTAVVDKEVAIIEATDYLERVFKSRWRGRRIDSNMSLSWPRYDVRDDDDLDVASNTVPTAVKHATAIMALKAGEAPTTSLFIDQSAADRGVKVDKTKAGPVEVETEYFAGNASLTKYPEVEGLLTPLLLHSSRIFRA